jgi:hypothetical protein
MSDVTVKVGAIDTNLASTLNKVQKDLKQVETQSKETSDKFGMSFKSMAAAGAGLAVGIGAVKLAFNAAKGTIDSFAEALDMGGRLNDLAGRTGESAGNMLLLERAFSNAGSSAEKVGPTINKLQKFLTDAAGGAVKNNEALAALGLNLKDLSNKAPVDQLEAFAKAITGVADPAQRAGLAMTVFGKSGGELLPLLMNFSDSVGDARLELGSMVSIMNENSGAFDTASDKLTVIKGKFTEFAAGVLDKTIPALELFTTALAQVDAAGIGQRLAAAFVGGQEAMNGFSASLQALKGGEFALSFEVAFASIKLQAKQTANEIYKNLSASFLAASEFLKKVIGPESAVWIGANLAIDMLSKNFQRGMLDAALAISDMFPRLFGDARKNIENNIKVTENGIAQTKELIGNLFSDGYIERDLIAAAKQFPETFQQAYQSTDPLFDLTNDLANVSRLQDEINKKAPELTFDVMDGVKSLEEYKVSGNYFHEQMKKAAAATKEAAGSVMRTLSLSEEIMKRIADYQSKEKLDPGGKLQKKADEALSSGNVKKAERVSEQLKKREEEADIRNRFGEKDKNQSRLLKGKEKEDFEQRDSKIGRSIKDIAKQEGIDTFRKTDAEIRKELLEKAGKGKGGVDNDGKREKIKDDAIKNDQVMTKIRDAVEAIKKAVEKIEPKLPQRALGA